MLDWPVRDGMLAFEEQLRADAVVEYHHAVLQWTVLFAAGRAKSKKPPPKPAILKD